MKPLSRKLQAPPRMNAPDENRGFSRFMGCTVLKMITIQHYGFDIVVQGCDLCLVHRRNHPRIHAVRTRMVGKRTMFQHVIRRNTI